MVDLQRLNSIIDNLDASATNFEKIMSIVDEVKKTASLVDDSANQLRSIINEVDALNSNSTAIQESIRSTHQKLEEHFKQTQLYQTQFTSQVNSLLLEIKNQGHDLNKQLENALEAKIDLMKSDIILDNRSKALETQGQISDSHKDLACTLTSVKTEISDANTMINNSQTTIINKIDQVYGEQKNELSHQFAFLKGVTITSVCLLVIAIIVLLVR
ncbi:hypothetical protein [Acetanaerobacterium elongatum]|uniref:Uncharacterized protein n=1 Tax=Acetanaerobacterium elongatum TaxID=258515 RepID=A0A1G9YPA7_9FIRM|nr:hypothetical protein [Acetanaerobacterium elongatum]SDN11038.1 hypothetical protein SAMN05192585_11169 [Acetanaerobacterium elongatum]